MFYVFVEYLKRKSKAFANGNREQIAFACNQLADFYNQMGDHRSALKEYTLAVDFYKKHGNKLSEAIAHRMVGEMYLYLNNFDDAKSHINDYFRKFFNYSYFLVLETGISDHYSNTETLQ